MQRDMSEERVEYATKDTNSRGRSARRLVRLPGETGYVMRSDSANDIARRIELERREKRLKKLTAGA
jgi:hypothetical protein